MKRERNRCGAASILSGDIEQYLLTVQQDMVIRGRRMGNLTQTVQNLDEKQPGAISTSYDIVAELGSALKEVRLGQDRMGKKAQVLNEQGALQQGVINTSGASRPGQVPDAQSMENVTLTSQHQLAEMRQS